MVEKKKAAPALEVVEHDRWDDAREVLIVAGTAVRPPLELDEVFVSVYLGKVRRKSVFGGVWMHLFQTPEGLQGMWGHHALDEGMNQADLGVETRIDGRGMMQLDKGKQMRLVRVRQLGGPVRGAPIVRDEQAEAEEVYAALGIEGDYQMDPATGEVVEGAVFGDVARR